MQTEYLKYSIVYCTHLECFLKSWPVSAIRKVYELFPPGKLVSELPRVFRTEEDIQRAAQIYEEASEMIDSTESATPDNRSGVGAETSGDGSTSTGLRLETVPLALAASKPTSTSAPATTAKPLRKNSVLFSKAITDQSSGSSCLSSPKISSVSRNNSEADLDGVAVELEVNGDRFLGRSQTARSARVAAAKAALAYYLKVAYDPQLYF